MFCPACERYRAPRHGRIPAFCDSCGARAVDHDADELASAIARRSFLLEQLALWQQAGQLERSQTEQLAEPYRADIAIAGRYLDAPSLHRDRPPAPHCHADRFEHAAETLDSPARYCPDCGQNLDREELVGAGRDATSDHRSDIDRAATDGARAATDVGNDAARQPASGQEPVASTPTPVASAVVHARQVFRELRPVFYETLLLLLGALLVFAGSIYFAIYFWERLGQYGPLVAGSLLSGYALGFAGAGYLLQRRYKSDLSARVLYAIATAILPVALTLAGEPLRRGSTGVLLVSASSVLAVVAIAYPAMTVAAALFQREIGSPFARAFAVFLLAVGFAPLAARIDLRPLTLVYLYLAAVPLVVLYHRVRDIGRVFEKATVVFVVGGSAYALFAVPVRIAIALDGGLALAELAPLVVLMAAAAIDLDVQWRERTTTARSTLGVVGVIAHATALFAVVLSLDHPVWRVLALLATGILFCVTSLRHRRPRMLHLGLASFVASLALFPWLPGIDSRPTMAFAGVLTLPVALGLARLAARWRQHAADEFAAPGEAWAILGPSLGAVAAVLLPHLGKQWQFELLGSWSAYLPALIVLPVMSLVLAIAWSWARRPAYVTAAIVAAATTLVVAVHGTGAEGVGLAATASGCALIAMAAVVLAIDHCAARLRRGVVDAALILCAMAAGALLVTRAGPWYGDGTTASGLAYLLVACTAVSVAAYRPWPQLGMLSVLALSAAFCAALWTSVSLPLLPAVIALFLLALAQSRGESRIGRARPFRSSYPVALLALCLAIVHAFDHAFAPAVTPPAEPLLIAVALLGVAARHRSPWPTYAAVACFLLAAYGAPHALASDIRPRTAAKLCGVALVIAALCLRPLHKLRPWRMTFLDVPLHLVALAAPVYLARLAWSLAVEMAGHPDSTLVVVRRVAAPLGAAILATISHGSRLHGYMAAIAFLCIGPAAAASLALQNAALAVSLIGTAGMAWLMAHWIGRNSPGTTRVHEGDRPLPLLGRWRLPSADLFGDLAIRPLSQMGAVAAVAGLAVAASESSRAWPAGSAAVATAYVLFLGYAIARYKQPHKAAGLPLGRGFVHIACATGALLAMELAHLVDYTPRSEGIALLGLAYYSVGHLLTRREQHLAPGARAVFEASGGLLLLSLLLWLAGALILDWPWDPITPAMAALVSVLLLRPYGSVTSIRGFLLLAGAAIYLATAGTRWQPAVLLLIANAIAASVWLARPIGSWLSRWARTELPDLSCVAANWSRAIAWTVGALFTLTCIDSSLYLRSLEWPALEQTSGVLMVATACHLLFHRRDGAGWALLVVASTSLAHTVVPATAAGRAGALLACAALVQLFSALADRNQWWSRAERDSLGIVALASSVVLAGLIAVTHRAHIDGPWTSLAAALLTLSLFRIGDRFGRGWPRAARILACSVALMATAAVLALWAFSEQNWLLPPGLITASLALGTSLGAWLHWILRRRIAGEHSCLARLVAHLASGWAASGALLALLSAFFPAPPAVPAALCPAFGLAAILLSTAWYGFTSFRSGQTIYGYVGQATLLLGYVHLRAGPLFGLDAEADAIAAIAFAFALHFLAELLRRTTSNALGHSATVGARFFPVGACMVVGWAALTGQTHVPTLEHAVLAETIAVLYTLATRRQRGLGVVATVFYNVGLVFLWIHTGQTDALYYTIPFGVSILVLTRIYRNNLSPGAARVLRIASSMLIYFSTYYQAVQFTSGLYPLLLGTLALFGVGVGFALQLRDLFLLSAGFLLLNVISNLTYYGIHRPILGWTLLTATGLLLTVSGILFQLRRDRIRELLSRARTAMSDWE
ncbi:MAG: hypothetical protein MJE77_24490 [Proteobacteria bacterium]|nr:hypothetical protein [Pseudomonadota bacterium]